MGSRSEKVVRAVRVAERAHAGHMRKGKSVPYMEHLLAVLELAERHGGSEDVLCAAVLHDSVEDVGMKLESLREMFGAPVAEMVAEVSDHVGDAKPAYEVRKAAYLDKMRNASPGAALVAACDKIANANDILADFAEVGDSVFDRFSRGKSKIGFYRVVAEVLKPKVSAALAAELEVAVSALEKL